MTQAKEILKKHLRPHYPGAITDEIIIAAMQEHSDLQTSALQEENRQLKDRVEKALKLLNIGIHKSNWMDEGLSFFRQARQNLTAYQQEQTNKTI